MYEKGDGGGNGGDLLKDENTIRSDKNATTGALVISLFVVCV